jgi:hypothetical protein
MKKIVSIIYVLLLLFSCSNDDNISNLPQNEPVLTNYIYKRYNTSNEPNTVIDSTNYVINNNKIISHSGLNTLTQSQYLSNYNYTNGKITNIESYNETTLTRIQSFTYNTNGNLVEYLSESIDTENQSSYFNKHLFTHNTDTIFSTWSISNDGVNFSPKIDSKIVLDENNNRTYYEAYDYINDDTQFIESLYDFNSNIIKESYYTIINNSNMLSFENTYLTTTNENYLNTINEATYGRKTYMLTYHLLPNAVNNINAKSITKNMLTEFNSTWGNSFATFDISNNIDDANLSLLSDFKTIIAGAVFNRFSQEYIFSNP